MVDLQPEEIRETCSGERLQRGATEALQEAFAAHHAQLRIFEQQALTEMPAIQAHEESVAVLELQVRGKREVVAGRLVEGFALLKDSWRRLNQTRQMLDTTDGARIRQYTDEILQRITGFGLSLERIPTIAVRSKEQST
jgi:hypothetical protein